MKKNTNKKYSHKEKNVRPQGPNVFSILGPYRKTIFLLVFLALLANGLNLLIPKIIAKSIDRYTGGTLIIQTMILEFLLAACCIFVFSYLQSVVQTYASERVARDMRKKLSDTISQFRFSDIESIGSSKLLTTLTADIDSIKMFVSMAIVSMVSSFVLIFGVSALLLSINWRLALVVLSVIPVIGITFFFIFSKAKVLFLKSREVIDKLNKVINESILGAAIIRVVHAQAPQYKKFLEANTEARSTGLSILALFAALIPIITFVASLATLAIVMLGGHFVIGGTMSLGDFTAFYSYLAMLIFPILIIGFMSSLIAQASASYARVHGVLATPIVPNTGTIKEKLRGAVAVDGVTLIYKEHSVLKNITFRLEPGTKTAIIGPTAAGKSQLLYVLTGLVAPTEGKILYDGKELSEYAIDAFHHQVALVFQDSVLFNMSIKENIAFTDGATEASVQKAIKAAELSDFIETLPDGIDTVVSERGTSLSGGQKQRIMLARALALNPKVLYLDDFTARVDTKTEAAILKNISELYPDLTLVSVTQKLAVIESYDRIIVLMEGEILGQGTHEQLLETSPDYVQIYNAQRSTNTYEVRT